MEQEDESKHIVSMFQKESGDPTLTESRRTESKVEEMLLEEKEDQVGTPKTLENESRPVSPASMESDPRSDTRSDSAGWEIEKRRNRNRMSRQRWREKTRRANEERLGSGQEGTSKGDPKSQAPSLKESPSGSSGRTSKKEDFPTLEEAKQPLYRERPPPPPRKTTRGPGARNAARERNKEEKRIILPNAPRSVRDSEGAAAGKITPPTRYKRMRGSQETPPSGGNTPKRVKDTGVSPLKRFNTTKAVASTSAGERPFHGTFRDVVREGGRDLQLVVMSSREGGTVTAQEGEQLRKSLKRFTLESMGNWEKKTGVVLQFWQSGIVEPGWLLVSAVDEISRDFTAQNWKPPNIEETSFKVLYHREAPWPTKIGINIREEEKPDPEEVKLEMHLRNRMPGAAEWKLDRISGEPGNWHLAMWIPRSSVQALDAVKWRVFLGLISVSVHRVRGGNATRKINPPSAEGRKEEVSGNAPQEGDSCLPPQQH